MILLPGPDGEPAWTAVIPPLPGQPPDLDGGGLDRPYVLNGIAAVSAAHAWAVGQSPGGPLLHRWTGTRWDPLPLGTPASHIGGTLLSVSAASSTSALAVGGAYDRLLGTDVPLLYAWNGATWTPRTPGTGYVLTAVTHVTPTLAWAVGHSPTTRTPITLPIPLNPATGRPRRTEAATPHGGPTPGQATESLAATVASRIRAGDRIQSGWFGARPEAGHEELRDGGGVPGVSRGRLLAVAASSPDDVWAVGARDGSAPLVVHFDGRTWSKIRAPRARHPLTSVAVIAADEVWVSDGDEIFRWNGHRWRPIRGGPTSINTLLALPSGDLWAAGAAGALARHTPSGWRHLPPPPPLDPSVTWLGSAPAGNGTGAWLVGSRHAPTPRTGASPDTRNVSDPVPGTP